MPETHTLTAIIGDLPGTKITIPAEETKLKGYSKFRFFCFKDGKYWHVCEWTTGREVSDGFSTTLAAAKKSAREVIAEKTDRDLNKLQEAIDAAIKDTGALNE